MKNWIAIEQPIPNSTTSGIQEALNRVMGTGGSVQLGAGEFFVEASLEIPNGTTLAGSGPATRIVLADGAGRSPSETHVIVNRDRDTVDGGITVRDLWVDGNYANQSWTSADLGGAGIAFDGCDRVTIERVRVTNTWRHGIWYLNGSGLTVSNCEIHTVGCSNISIGGQHHFRRFTENVQIVNCRLSDSRKTIGRKAGNCGIEIKDHTRRVLVSNCLSHDHQDGYAFAVLVHRGRHPEQSVSHVAISNCLAWNSIHGFAAGSSGDFPVADLSLNGCEAYGNRKSGLCLYAIHGGTLTSVGVHGCNFHDNGEYGIAVEGDRVLGVDLTGNRLYQNGVSNLSLAEGLSDSVTAANQTWGPSRELAS